MVNPAQVPDASWTIGRLCSYCRDMQASGGCRCCGFRPWCTDDPVFWFCEDDAEPDVPAQLSDPKRPRLAYVLGLITGQSFGIRHPGTKEMVSGLSINEDGYLCKDGDVAHNSVGWLCYAINHPEHIFIENKPRRCQVTLTEPEIVICQDLGAACVTRSGDLVYLWDEEPRLNDGAYWSENTPPLIIPSMFFPSLPPGGIARAKDGWGVEMGGR